MDFYILAGSLASGKGTQSRLIAKKYKDVKVISTGELFRDKMKKDSNFKIRAEEKINSGRLLSDETTNKMVVENLDVLQKKIKRLFF